MKVEQGEKIFVPVVITLETQEEVDEIFDALQYARVTRSSNLLINNSLKGLYIKLTKYRTNRSNSSNSSFTDNVRN